jgi:hypothetical protein
VSLSLSLGSMAVERSRPREANWLPARNLGAVVEAIRNGHQEVATPAAARSPADRARPSS